MFADIFTQYLYFWGSLVGLVMFGIVIHARKDLQRRMIRMGIAVGVAGIFSEGVFFRDYWHPPLVLRFGRFGGIEDLFFGIAFGGMCVVLYDVVFHKRLRRKGYPHYWITSLLIVSEILSVSILGNFMNSIYASAIGFILPAVVIIIIRHDLIIETFFSAILGGSILAFVEMILLMLAPNYLQHYYFLYHKAPLIFGIVPFTEFLWGASFAAIVGPLRDFEFGYVPVSIKSNIKRAKTKKHSNRWRKSGLRKVSGAVGATKH